MKLVFISGVGILVSAESFFRLLYNSPEFVVTVSSCLLPLLAGLGLLFFFFFKKNFTVILVRFSE